jgi:hypothetical protein
MRTNFCSRSHPLAFLLGQILRWSYKDSTFSKEPTRKNIMKHIIAAVAIFLSLAGINALAQEGNSTNSSSATTTNQVASTNKIKLTVIKVDSEETASENGRGTNAVDGNPGTIWHTEWTDANPECPHEIIIQLNPPSTIKGFTYLPRQDDEENGNIRGYEFYISDDGKDFGKPVKKGEFSGGKEKKTVVFDQPVKCGFFKLRALSEINDNAWSSAAEIGVVPAE